MVTGLTRQDREALVVELDRQGKTYREIAKEARMSPRDIRQILKKGNLEQPPRFYLRLTISFLKIKLLCKQLLH